jgi:hypothetical protein
MAESISNRVDVSRRPVHTIRYGAVRAAVWRNMVDNGNASRPMYAVAFGRRYKDAGNHWQESSSFGLDDLLLLAKVADEAHSWIARENSADK